MQDFQRMSLVSIDSVQAVTPLESAETLILRNDAEEEGHSYTLFLLGDISFLPVPDKCVFFL